MPMTKEELQKFKVTQLKERCREAGLKVSGTKAQLIERLLERDTSRGEQSSSQVSSTKTQTTKKRTASTSQAPATKQQKIADGGSAASSRKKEKKQPEASITKQSKASLDTRPKDVSSFIQSGKQYAETIKGPSISYSKTQLNGKKPTTVKKSAPATSSMSPWETQITVKEPTSVKKLTLINVIDTATSPAAIDTRTDAKALTSKPSMTTRKTAKLKLQINRSSLKEAVVNLPNETKQPMQFSNEIFLDDSINLPTIQRPPKASRRRMVEGLSIALAWGGRESIHLALCINREWSYAAQLAWRQLCEHCFGGTRLDSVESRNDPSTRNYYAYFSSRKEECLQNTVHMNNTWLAKFYNSIDRDICTAIHPRLFWCPDDTRQLRIALRFCMTRLIHMVALYQNQIEGGGKLLQLPRVVNILMMRRDTCHIELEDGTIARILDATGEVIGSVHASADLSKRGIVRVRQDWEHFLRQQDERPLIEHVFTLDTDYPHGVHKSLLTSSLEYEIAARFVLANVDPECISGGSTASKMRMTLTPKFCVESIILPGQRFGSRRLCNDFALVQTSERGYFVLAETGLAMGNDDEGGLEGIWEGILGSPYEVAQASSHNS